MDFLEKRGKKRLPSEDTILQMRKLRHREVKNLCKDTQPLRCRAKFSA